MHISKECAIRNGEGTSSEDDQETVISDQSKYEEDCIKDLLTWLDENPHINARNDRNNLLYFLRGCKFDLIRTKRKIQGFYLMRAERNEWFSNRNPFLPEIQELLNIGVFLPLKVRDNEGRLVVIIRTGAHDPKKYLQNDVLKTGKMVLDLVLHQNETISLTGVVAIFDMKNVQLGHALQMTPTLVKRSVESWQLYPCKLKLIEFINAPTHINVILNTFRFFMTSKMKSRLNVRSSTSMINVPLPKDLGGTGESYCELAKYWKQCVEENVEFFINDEKFKTNIENNAQ